MPTPDTPPDFKTVKPAIDHASPEPAGEAQGKPGSTRNRTGERPVLAARSGDGESDGNSASNLIEAPVISGKTGRTGKKKLQRHDFPDGGGSGGAEAFRRKPP